MLNLVQFSHASSSRERCLPHRGGEREESAPESKRILIVEDNETNMRLLNDLLQFRGHTTIQAADAIEGFRLVHEQRPDLIVLDIQLPGVSGLELARWIKEDDRLNAIPVVAVTAFAMAGDKERILEGGCDGYVSKPISVAAFLNTVEEFLK